MNSRDVANNCVQASALDARCKQARDPATAGVRVMVAARRSISSPRAQGVICALDSSPINYAGRVRSVGGFFAAAEYRALRDAICRDREEHIAALVARTEALEREADADVMAQMELPLGDAGCGFGSVGGGGRRPSSGLPSGGGGMRRR